VAHAAAAWRQRGPGLRERLQDDDAARQDLSDTAGAFAGEPRLVSFTSGRRRQSWVKNVVALGHAAGMLEPLAITDFQQVGHGLLNLLDHFPDKQFDPALIASYNAAIGEDLEQSRDFIILHYGASRRDDTPFWQQRDASCRRPWRSARAVPRHGRVILQQPGASPTSTGSGSSRAAASCRAITTRWSTPWISSR
jgi:tryptophan halogenase